MGKIFEALHYAQTERIQMDKILKTVAQTRPPLPATIEADANTKVESKAEADLIGEAGGDCLNTEPRAAGDVQLGRTQEDVKLIIKRISAQLESIQPVRNVVSNSSIGEQTSG